MSENNVLDLNDQKNGKWIIGTTPDVSKESPFYSEQIQVKHNYIDKETRKVIRKDEFLKKKGEEYHAHKPPTTEFYFVLEGILTVEVDKEPIQVEEMQILAVPPMKCHQVKDYALSDSGCLRYITMRATPKENKLLCDKSTGKIYA